MGKRDNVYSGTRTFWFFFRDRTSKKSVCRSTHFHFCPAISVQFGVCEAPISLLRFRFFSLLNKLVAPIAWLSSIMAKFRDFMIKCERKYGGAVFNCKLITIIIIHDYTIPATDVCSDSRAYWSCSSWRHRLISGADDSCGWFSFCRFHYTVFP